MKLGGHLQDHGITCRFAEIACPLDHLCTSQDPPVIWRITPETLWFGAEVPIEDLQAEDFEEASELEASSGEESESEEEELDPFANLDPTHKVPTEIQQHPHNIGMKVDVPNSLL